jgi:AcrR family transcriptional regulator
MPEMARPRLHDENLRLRLLENAGRLVTEHGVQGLSLRTLAVQSDTSTTAIYSLFGGKTGLLGALFDEAFESFGASQRAVPVSGNPVNDLARLGRAYWDWARLHPQLYGVMFSQALAGVERTPQQAAKAEATMQPLAAVVDAAVDSGLLAGDRSTITFSVWAAVHGVVSLTLADCAPPDEKVRTVLFIATAEAIVRGWTRTSQRSAGPNLRDT